MQRRTEEEKQVLGIATLNQTTGGTTSLKYFGRRKYSRIGGEVRERGEKKLEGEQEEYLKDMFAVEQSGETQVEEGASLSKWSVTTQGSK